MAHLYVCRAMAIKFDLSGISHLLFCVSSSSYSILIFNFTTIIMIGEKCIFMKNFMKTGSSADAVRNMIRKNFYAENFNM
jgi:hypothetical protein